MKMQRNLLFISLLLYALAAQALNGWKMSAQSDALLYLPTDLPSGKTYEYRVYGPYDPGDAELKSWFSDQAQTIQTTLGKPLEPWVVKPDKQKWSISNSFRNSDGQVFSVGYEGGRLDDGRVYIMRMVSSKDLMLMMKYGFEFYPVLDEAKQVMLPLKQEAGRAALGVMDRHLTDRDWFVGEAYSIADMCLYGYTNVADQGGYDLASFPAVSAWLARVAAQPGHVTIDQV